MALCAAAYAEVVPLEGEGKLEGLFLGDGAAVLLDCLSQRLRLAAAQRLGPVGPRAGAKLAAQYGVESVVGEPGRLGAAKLLKLLPLIG